MLNQNPWHRTGRAGWVFAANEYLISRRGRVYLNDQSWHIDGILYFSTSNVFAHIRSNFWLCLVCSSFVSRNKIFYYFLSVFGTRKVLLLSLLLRSSSSFRSLSFFPFVWNVACNVTCDWTTWHRSWIFGMQIPSWLRVKLVKVSECHRRSWSVLAWHGIALEMSQ